MNKLILGLLILFLIGCTKYGDHIDDYNCANANHKKLLEFYDFCVESENSRAICYHRAVKTICELKPQKR